MKAPHRYSSNVSADSLVSPETVPVWCILFSHTSEQPWHLTHNKVFHLDLLRRWPAGGINQRPYSSPTWRRRRLSEFLVLAAVLLASFSLLHHPQPPPTHLPLASQPVCSLISPCRERIDEALVSPGMFIGECLLGEEIGLEQGGKKMCRWGK